MHERRGQVAEAVVGLLFTTMILFFLDRVIAQAFNTGLTDPTFANSAAGAIWKLAAFIFGLHLDILGMWVGAIFSWGGKH